MLQTSVSLQTKLRRGNFQLLERPPRMLPRMFNPVQLNVDCSAKTPMKEAEGKKRKAARGGKASGDSRASRPSSAGGRSSVAGTLAQISLLSIVWHGVQSTHKRLRRRMCHAITMHRSSRNTCSARAATLSISSETLHGISVWKMASLHHNITDVKPTAKTQSFSQKDSMVQLSIRQSVFCSLL